MLWSQGDVFALSDEELGETDLVTHDINTGSARLVRAMPRRLPYAVRKELEVELKQLLDIGCIKPSSGSYAFPLVLIRRKFKGMCGLLECQQGYCTRPIPHTKN